MTRIPRITGKELVRALGKAGFVVIRVRGIHHFFAHADGRTTVVPVHAKEYIGPGLLAKILRDCDMTAAELRSLL